MNFFIRECEQSFAVPWIEFPDQSAWNDVLHLGKSFNWKPKEVILKPEDKADGIILVRSGLIKVVAASKNGLQRALWLQGAGSVIGEAALFAGRLYNHYFIAIEKTSAYVFSKDDLLENLIINYPQISIALLANVSAKSYIMSSQVEEATFLSAPQRIGRFFYGLCLARCSLQLPLTHELIAELLGVHRVTVSNTISMLKRIGLLEDVSSGIVVSDLRTLETFLSEA